MTRTTLMTPPEPELCFWRPVSGHRQDRLCKLREAVEFGKPAWWGRSSFVKPEFRDIKPRMHLFAGRSAGPDDKHWYDTTWHAACGYTFDPDEILNGPPRVTTTTPTKTERCTKCDRIYRELLVAAREDTRRRRADDGRP